MRRPPAGRPAILRAAHGPASWDEPAPGRRLPSPGAWSATRNRLAAIGQLRERHIMFERTAKPLTQAGASRSRKPARRSSAFPSVSGCRRCCAPGDRGEQERTVGVDEARHAGRPVIRRIAREGTHRSLPLLRSCNLEGLESFDQPEAVGLAIGFNLVESGISQDRRHGPPARSPTLESHPASSCTVRTRFSGETA